MRKLIVVLALTLALFTACNGGEAWPQADQDAFIENCERTSGGQEAYCQCALDEAMALESNPEDITAGQMAEVVDSCREEIET